MYLPSIWKKSHISNKQIVKVEIRHESKSKQQQSYFKTKRKITEWHCNKDDPKAVGNKVVLKRSTENKHEINKLK